MIYDKGKFIITLVLVIGLLVIVGICLATHQEVPPFVALALGSVTTYMYVNGKQLVAPFTPSPMMVPTPAKAKALLARELEDVPDADD